MSIIHLVHRNPRPTRTPSPRRRRRVLLHAEELEPRTLLAAAVPLGVAHPSFEILLPGQGLVQAAGGYTAKPGSTVAAPAYTSGQSPPGYWPSQLRHAYGFDKLNLDGSGTTIAIVDAYRDPNIASDLQKFDSQFSLPDPTLTRVNQNGNSDSSVPTDSTGGWEMEEALDVEWAHAIAPKANILLVEASSASFGNLLTAVNTARNASGVVAVSMSWGGSEFFGESSYDSYFTTPSGHTGVTFLASSGDNGAPAGYPATSPKVLAVGGTTLGLDGSDNRTSETGWNGSGGGPSSVENEPNYQNTYAQSSYVQNTLGNTVLLNLGSRGNPDVSYVADPSPGVAIYDTYANQYGLSGWFSIGGTSDAAPQWAALMALVAQGRGSSGSLDGATQTLPDLYRLASSSTSYANDFFDVTSGNNGYSAGTGYDFVTGLGSPRANNLVPDLIGNSGSFSVTASNTSPTAGQSFSVTVTALNASGQTNTAYTGTVHFTSSDKGSGVALPSDYTFTAADAGVHTFTNGVTLVTAGSQTVTATDTATSSITGKASVTVSPAAASTLTVSAPASVIQGYPFTLTVTAKDRYGNTATGYTGTAHFTTSDTGSGVAVPADYTFTAADNGTHAFTNGATLVTVGTQTVTATDTVTGSITGQASVTVNKDQATHFLVSAPTASTAGNTFSVTVTALDASNNTVKGYTGTVHFTSSDTGSSVVLPADYTFAAADNGKHTFTGVTLVTAGSQTVTATDTATSSITGKASVTVSPAAASALVLGAPSSVTQGSAFTLTVTAKDRYGNTATGYAGTVHFTTSDTDSSVVLPANYTFTAADAGVHTFTNGVTLATAGSQTVTATDTATSSVTGKASVTVTQQSKNLIANGGFETGDFTGWSVSPAPDTSYFGVDTSNPNSGNYAAYFGSYSSERDDIYQNVSTTAGHSYQISYWVSYQGGGSTEIRSSWGGTVLEDLFPTNAFDYEQHTFTEKATSSSTEFRIGGSDAPSNFYIDDVSITDVTTPSVALGGTGIPTGSGGAVTSTGGGPQMSGVAIPTASGAAIPAAAGTPVFFAAAPVPVSPAAAAAGADLSSPTTVMASMALGGRAAPSAVSPASSALVTGGFAAPSAAGVSAVFTQSQAQASAVVGAGADALPPAAGAQPEEAPRMPDADFVPEAVPEAARFTDALVGATPAQERPAADVFFSHWRRDVGNTETSPAEGPGLKVSPTSAAGVALALGGFWSCAAEDPETRSRRRFR